jgi:hypothetical protein
MGKKKAASFSERTSITGKRKSQRLLDSGSLSTSSVFNSLRRNQEKTFVYSHEALDLSFCAWLNSVERIARQDRAAGPCPSRSWVMQK